MSDIQVTSLTQVVNVESIPQTLTLLDQQIIVDAVDGTITIVDSPTTVNVEQSGDSVSVINAGPPGPRGYSSTPTNAAQAAFQEASGLEQKDIEYVDGLPSTISYYSNASLTYVSTIVYTDGLPTLITLVNQENDQTFEKEITYVGLLPTSVEWRVA